MPTPMAPGILSAKGDAMSLTIAVSAFSLIARCGVAYLRACRRPPGSTAFHRDYSDDPLGSACPPVRHEAGWRPLTKPRGGRDRFLKSVSGEAVCPVGVLNITHCVLSVNHDM